MKSSSDLELVISPTARQAQSGSSSPMLSTHRLVLGPAAPEQSYEQQKEKEALQSRQVLSPPSHAIH